MSSITYTEAMRRAESSRESTQVMAPDEKDIGLRLQEIRKRRGKSQVEVAQKLGIHQSLVSQYERGYLRLHGALLLRFAEVLHTSPDEILGVRQTKENGTDHSLDRRFVRRLHKIGKLSPHDKKLLLGTIDAFLAKVS